MRPLVLVSCDVTALVSASCDMGRSSMVPLQFLGQGDQNNVQLFGHVTPLTLALISCDAKCCQWHHCIS